MRKLGAAKVATLGAMCTALSVLCVYAASVLPTARIACYFVSSLFVYILSGERAYVGAIASYLASSAVAFLIVPNPISVAPFIALLGHYGIFKAWIDDAVKDRFLRAVIKLIYCDVFTGALIYISVVLIGVDVSFLKSLPFPLWALIPILQAVFFLYDLLFWLCQRIYDERIRPFLMPRR